MPDVSNYAKGLVKTSKEETTKTPKDKPMNIVILLPASRRELTVLLLVFVVDMLSC